MIFFGTVAFCFELLDEEVCELDTPVVRSVCSLPSGSGKSDVSSSDKSASSLFAAIAVVGMNKLQTQCVVVGRKDQKNLWFSVQCEPQDKQGQVIESENLKFSPKKYGSEFVHICSCEGKDVH